MAALSLSHPFETISVLSFDSIWKLSKLKMALNRTNSDTYHA